MSFMRGPNKQTIELLPNEILVKILNYLPATSFSGITSIQPISKTFCKLAEDKSLSAKQSKQAILESADNLDNALLILSQTTFLNKLTFEEIFNVANRHPSIRTAILENHCLKKYNKAYLLAHFGKQTLEYAEYILNEPELYQQLEGEDLAKLGIAHFDIAQRIIKSKLLTDRLYQRHLISLGAAHLKIARQWLNDPKICTQLDGTALERLALPHHEIAEQVLNTQSLVEKLSPNNLAMLGKHHYNIALAILHQPNLYNRLSAQDLVELGRNNSDIASQILDNPALKLQLNPEYLALLVAPHHDLACALLKDTHTPTSREVMILAGLHKDIAEHLLSQPALFKTLSRETLVHLGSLYEESAKKILNTEALSQTLDRDALVTIAAPHQTLATDLLQKATFATQLTSDNLLSLGKPHLNVAQQILSNAKLSKKLDYCTLIKLIRSHHSLAIENFEKNAIVHFADELNAALSLNLTPFYYYAKRAYPEAKKNLETEFDNQTSGKIFFWQNLFWAYKLIVLNVELADSIKAIAQTLRITSTKKQKQKKYTNKVDALRKEADQFTGNLPKKRSTRKK